jgi:hypothetical protein
MPDTKKVAVIIYSAYGHVKTLSGSVGTREGGDLPGLLAITML